MSLYLVQFAYTAEVWAALAQNPQNRENVIRAAAEQFGCRLLFFAYSFGEYDGVAVIEAPNEATVTTLLLTALVTGSYKASKTTVLFTADEMVNILRQVGSRPFQAPGR